MANDYLKKQPSKNEQMFYELAMHMRHLDNTTHSNAAQILALGMMLGVDPAKLAELLVNGDEKLKEYGKKINEEIDKLTKAKQPVEKQG